MFERARDATTAVFRDKYGADFPSTGEITSHVSVSAQLAVGAAHGQIAYAFTNNEPLLDVAPPTISRVIAVPALGARAPVPLDAHWNEVYC